MPFDFDDHQNLAIATIAVAPAPPLTGTSLQVAPGEGGRFPAPPFNVTLFTAIALPDPTNAEVARCTAIAGDVLTLLRAQEGTTARAVQAGDLIAETITAKALTDIENAVTALEGTVASGPVAAHATQHEVGGSDPIDGDLSLANLTASGDVVVTNKVQANNLVWAVGRLQIGSNNILPTTDGVLRLANSTGLDFSLLQFGGTTAAFPALQRVGAGLAVVMADGSALSALMAQTLQAAATGSVYWTSRAYLSAPASGQLLMQNEQGTDFSLLQFGGTTAAFPALKRNSTTLEVMLADNSAYAGIQTLWVSAISGLVLLQGGAVLRTGSGDPNGIYSHAVGSIFQRLDGSTGTTLYVKETGAATSTGWVPMVSGGGGGGGAHHLTHEVGGSDPITGALSISTLTTSGHVTVGGNVVLTTTNGSIRQDTLVGADTKAISLSGAGGGSADRGACVNVYGNQHAGGGQLQLIAGNTALGRIEFYTGDVVKQGTIHRSGGFSWGSSTDPGAGSFSLAGDLILGDGSAGRVIRPNTPDGNDTGSVTITGGGAGASSRGALISVYGNESAAPGTLSLATGDKPTSAMDFFTGPGFTHRGRIHQSGGFSWGGVNDPGAGHFFVGTAPYTCDIVNGTIRLERAETTGATLMTFFTGSGGAGYIICTGTTTQYVTTSDARLKTPLSRHTDPDVLRKTIIHDFLWKSDGTAGRGVFAQEAHEVAPFAVSVGTDERDDEGHFTKPWGVDYSKYVPDLIAGWQQHEAEIAALKAQLALLRGR